MKVQTSIENTKGQVILYKNKLEVRLTEETVWIDAHAIARIFDVDRTVIIKHIGNIYKTGELDSAATCAKIAQVAADGKTRQMNIYNLDVILSV
jgi:hypothetical protein